MFSPTNNPACSALVPLKLLLEKFGQQHDALKEIVAALQDAERGRSATLASLLAQYTERSPGETLASKSEVGTPPPLFSPGTYPTPTQTSHHTIYTLLLTLLILPHSFSTFFTTCCILELPTFLLSIGSLYPRLRNDYVFAGTFFVLRICLHGYLVWVTLGEAVGGVRGGGVRGGVGEVGGGFESNGLGGLGIGGAVGWGGRAGGDWTRPTCLALAFPMHALWMKDCIRGILRRRKRRRLTTVSLTSESLTTSESLSLASTSTTSPIPITVISNTHLEPGCGNMNNLKLKWKPDLGLIGTKTRKSHTVPQQVKEAPYSSSDGDYAYGGDVSSLMSFSVSDAVAG